MSKHDPQPSKMASTEKRAEIVQGLREMADFLAERPDVPIHADYGIPHLELYAEWFEDDPITTSPRRVARAMGKADKGAPSWSNQFELTRRFPGGVFYRFNFPREQICEPTIVGQRDVIEKGYTDEERAAELKAQLAELEVDRVTGQEPILEYDCQPLLSKA